MPAYCSAIYCNNSSDKIECKERKVSFHSFPLKDKALLKEWDVKMKRKDFVPKEHSRICSDHFEDDCFTYQNFTNRKTLKSGAIPTKFSFNTTGGDRKRKKTSYEFKPATSREVSSGASCSQLTQTDEDVVSTLLNQLEIAEQKITSLKLEITQKVFCLEKAILDESSFNSLTGFTPVKFNVVFSFLNLQYVDHRNMSPRDQFFIFLVRLRSGVTLEFLSGIFNISLSTVSRILADMTDFIYEQFQTVDIWPSKELIREFMPEEFNRVYPNCRIILDSTEIVIEKPSKPRLQQLTFSHYKNKNTLKALIGITPSGAISYISDLWCGGISDKEMFMRSGLLNLLENDTVMVDRGFTIEKELRTKNCKLVMPHFLKDKIQFTSSQRSENKSVSHLRVHVERAISRIKKYRYFRGPIPSKSFYEVNKVFFIAASFANFQNPLISIN